MASSSRSKRRSSIAPITVDEILGSAGMSGFVSFLKVKPEDYGRPAPSNPPKVEAGPASTVAAEPSPTVEAGSTSTVEFPPDITVEVQPPSTVESGAPSIVEAEPRIRKTGSIKVEVGSASTMEAVPSSTIEAGPQTTVEVGSRSTVEDGFTTFWTIEGLGGAFPASRLRRIERAQDVLTHVEESVYDVLWGVKDHSRDRFRRTVMGYEEIARKARASKRGVVGIIQRLVQKGFIEIACQPQTFGARRPTEYRVFSYAAVREGQRARNRVWTIRTGNGIGYARPLDVRFSPSTIEAGSVSTIEDAAGSTMESDPGSTVEAGQNSTVETGEHSTVEAGSTIPLIDRKQRQEHAATATAAVVAAIHESMGRADDDAAARIVEACRAVTPDITGGEIAYFVRREGPALQRNRSLDNPMGVLIRHIPRCCQGEGLRLHREAARMEEERTRRQVEAWIADARAVLANPEASQTDRGWAEDILSAYSAEAGKEPVTAGAGQPSGRRPPGCG